MARTTGRVRPQISLPEQWVGMLQKAPPPRRIHPTNPAVLAGLALEAAENLPAGTEVRIQLASEDEALGEPLAARLREKRPDLSVSFDPDAAPILGGVWLSAPDGSWRSPADWREVIAEVKDALAERILSIL